MKRKVNFKIQRLNWTLRLVEDLDTDCGQTFYRDCLIEISDTLPKDMLKRTIIHELTHAFRWSYGHLSSVEIAGWPSEAVEELIANTVETYGQDILEMANTIMEDLEK